MQTYPKKEVCNGMCELNPEENLHKKCVLMGDDETRSGYVRYVQDIQPNIPAHTTFIDMLTLRTLGFPQVTRWLCSLR